ncbi:hypothetical protein LV89_02011 [Arcicella aurantiaca]|uniref:Uncharacterized protein n=1 Tax=Arcicella aurantiaca TaxID=591202 RepID=A0A316EVH1_9BACT|nr:hypothetical protein [Arcicella aurantiaca]PWK27196.1 hypothetical protein LV89_02011 [Arcicella aurantiaca]
MTKLSKRYEKVKKEFLKLENPLDKLKRLQKEERAFWEQYEAKSNELTEYFGKLNLEYDRYSIQKARLFDCAITWDERTDYYNITPSTEVRLDIQF